MTSMEDLALIMALTCRTPDQRGHPCAEYPGLTAVDRQKGHAGGTTRRVLLVARDVDHRAEPIG
jgi:hypothetical protein